MRTTLTAIAIMIATTSVSLAAPGDADGNNVVNSADYIVWSDNFGAIQPIGPAEGDFNFDGLTDGLDYLVWSDNYGFVGPFEFVPHPPIAITTVPEPSTLGMAVLGISAILMRRRRISTSQQNPE